MRQAYAITMALLVLGGGLAPLAAAGSAAGGTPASTAPTAVPAATSTPASSTVADANGTDAQTDAPADPNEDVLGWEEVNGHGLWYNESITVTREDGLNDTELDVVVARAMARVEVVRQMEFEQSVPVQIISRSEYRNQTADQFANVTEKDRLHQNVKWEAMLMVGEDTDALAVQESNRGSTVLGYYSPSREAIVIVSNNESAPKMNEITLSQELFHALQDQRFNLSSYNRSTEETNNAISGIIEGDGNLVDNLYEKRCEAEWDCLMPQGNDAGGGGSDIHFGMYLVSFQPYSDGPPFVQGIYQDGGWEAVNAVYENPPASTEQVIHPEKYGEDPPAEMTFTDRSNEEWRILDLGHDGSVNYATFGEAGLATLLFYPFYDSGRTQQPILRVQEFFNLTSNGQVSSFDPISYGNEYTDGWDGDRLYPYVNDQSMDTNETGYVWKSVWDSEEDAQQWVNGYTQALNYYGAEPIEGRENTYRIPEDRPYNDAFYVQREGDTVWIVNAPSVEDLSAVRKGAAPEAMTTTTTTEETTTMDDGGDTTTTTGGETTTTGGETTTTGGGDGTTASTPGFGPIVAILALLAAVLLFARRIRD